MRDFDSNISVRQGVHLENNWVNCRFHEHVDAARRMLAYPKSLAAEIATLRMALVNFHR